MFSCVCSCDICDRDYYDYKSERSYFDSKNELIRLMTRDGWKYTKKNNSIKKIMCKDCVNESYDIRIN